jgi:hypothetical protein
LATPLLVLGLDMRTYRGMLRGSLWVISVAILVDAIRRLV